MSKLKRNLMAGLADYRDVVGQDVVDEIRVYGEKLKGAKVVHVNSTRIGGGVAEILGKLIPLLRESGIDAEWHVIKGDDEFFKVTKDFHNALHGAPTAFKQSMFDHFLKVNERNAQEIEAINEAEFVVIHDPQPVALIRSFPRRKGKWIWRCHIDISTPNHQVWGFLEEYIAQYDAAVFHVDRFARRDLLIRQFIVPPSIDPLSPKNRNMSPENVRESLEQHGLNLKKPIIAQIGRFDRLKDPEGVVTVYQRLKHPEGIIEFGRFPRGGEHVDITQFAVDRVDCQLLLAGGLATDDPEGHEVYRSVLRKAGKDLDVHILILPPYADLDINAMQRGSSVVLQKSLKEGFGLTVSEALWKGTPVIGGNTGGIPLQVINGVNGFLVSSIDEAAAKVRFLLNNPKRAKDMGKAGIDHVRKNFLITRHVRDHLLIYLTLRYLPRRLVQV